MVDSTPDGLIELTAPDGEVLFRVLPETAEMIARSLLDEVEALDEN